MDRGVTAGARPRPVEGRRPRYGEDDLEPVDITEDRRSGDHGINESRSFSESGLGDLAACADSVSSAVPSFGC